MTHDEQDGVSGDRHREIEHFTERQDRREPWLHRLLKNPLLSSTEVLEPWARQTLATTGQQGQTIILSMDQTDLRDRFAMLMVSLGIGDRA